MCLSFEDLPKSDTRQIATGDDRGVEQQIGKVAGICEGQIGCDLLELMQQVYKNFDTRGQIQNAADLLLRFERLTDALVLP